jgi:hypothetical protein
MWRRKGKPFGIRALALAASLTVLPALPLAEASPPPTAQRCTLRGRLQALCDARPIARNLDQLRRASPDLEKVFHIGSQSYQNRNVRSLSLTGDIGGLALFNAAFGALAHVGPHNPWLTGLFAVPAAVGAGIYAHGIHQYKKGARDEGARYLINRLGQDDAMLSRYGSMVAPATARRYADVFSKILSNAQTGVIRLQPSSVEKLQAIVDSAGAWADSGSPSPPGNRRPRGP